MPLRISLPYHFLSSFKEAENMRVLFLATMLAAFLFYGKATAEQSVTVAWYGGNWGDAFNACVAKPFTETTGIAVKPEIGTSIVELSKRTLQMVSATIELALLDG